MTIYDIAKAAGVSASTVSRVINDKPGINEETRKRIKKLLQEYNYSPNEAARGLVMQSSKIIGILIEDIRVEHHTESAYVIEQEMTKLGYTCITLSTGHSVERKVEYIKILEQRRVEGVILMGSMFGTDAVAEGIREHLANVPVAIVNGYLDLPNVYGVLIDEKHGVEECVSLLAGKGRRNLAFAWDSMTPSNQNKMNGFMAGMQNLGTEQNQALIYDASSEETGPERVIKRGKEVTRTILKEHPDIQGILYSVDLLAIGGLEALAEAGIPVPAQVAVMGVDNTLYGKICTPKLSTLDNKLVETSKNASRVLLEALHGDEVSHKIMLFAEIIERETT